MSDAAPPVTTAESASAAPATTDRPGWVGPVAVAIVWLAFWQVAPRLRADSVGAVIISTVVSLSLIVWFVAQVARALRTARAIVLNGILAAGFVLPLRIMAGSGRIIAPWNILPHIPGLPDLLFVWFAACIGTSLSRLLRGANMIPPVAAVLALVDTWTVLLGGPVQRIMQSANPMARAITKAMTVTLPGPRAGASPIQISTIVGFADFLFIAFFIAAVVRFVELSGAYRSTTRATIAVLSIYMIVINFTGWSLPALVPLAVVMIALHWRHFHYDRSEAFALLYAVLFIVVIAAGFWFLGRSPRPTQDAPRAAVTFAQD